MLMRFKHSPEPMPPGMLPPVFIFNFFTHFCSMKITEDVRRYAAAQGLSDDEALQQGLAEKSREFAEKGAQLYTKA